jgi:hypothetical protein
VSEEEHVLIGRVPDHGGASSAVERTDGTPLERLDLVLEVSILRLSRRAGGGYQG